MILQLRQIFLTDAETFMVFSLIGLRLSSGTQIQLAHFARKTMRARNKTCIRLRAKIALGKLLRVNPEFLDYQLALKLDFFNKVSYC